MLMQTKAKTASRVDLNAVERPALLKIRLKSDANFLTQRYDLNRRDLASRPCEASRFSSIKRNFLIMCHLASVLACLFTQNCQQRIDVKISEKFKIKKHILN